VFAVVAKMLLHWHWDWLIPWKIKKCQELLHLGVMSVFNCGIKDKKYVGKLM
jgi:hypothetical protein